MDEPLTPDEDVVYQEFTRLDVEPNQIPPDLYAVSYHDMSNVPA